MRRIATLLGAVALTGALVVPVPAAAAESPLPQLTEKVCQTQAVAEKPAAPSQASVLLGPALRSLPEVSQSQHIMESPQIC